MINRVSFQYGTEMNPTQLAAEEKVDEISTKLISIQDIVVRSDNVAGIDQNPQRGKVKMNHTFKDMNSAVKFNGKAEYRVDGEPYMTSMDMSLEYKGSRGKEHIVYKEKTKFDENGDGNKEAEGMFVQIKDESQGSKTTLMINDETEVITLIEEPFQT